MLPNFNEGHSFTEKRMVGSDNPDLCKN